MSKSTAQRVVFRTMLGNVFLVFLKLLVGVAASSASLVAEAIHSAGDILASLGVLLSFRLSGRPPDEQHHFGHGKVESLCTCIIGSLLIIIGYELTREALARLAAGTVEIPGATALYIALICILIKELMYRYTIHAACQTGSQLLTADAWHHRADMMILSGVFLGITGSRLGYPVLDGMVALFISVLIIRLGFGFCRRGLGDLLDTAPEEGKMEPIREKIKAFPGIELHCLRARRHASEIHLELHIGVNEDLCVREGHNIAHKVKESLLADFPEIKHILVHVNPVSSIKQEKAP